MVAKWWEHFENNVGELTAGKANANKEVFWRGLAAPVRSVKMYMILEYDNAFTGTMIT